MKYIRQPIQQYELGEGVTLYALVRTLSSNPNVPKEYTDTANGCKIYILDSYGTVLIDNVAMTKAATGIYEYNYAIPTTGKLGRYLFQIVADDTLDVITEWYFDVVAQKRTTYPL